MNELKVEKIEKYLDGRKVLDKIELDLYGGCVYGFTGRNGSGKTMLFRAISGLVKVDSGKVIYNGRELSKKLSILPSLGIIIENTGMYPEFTGYQNLQMLANIRRKIGKSEIKAALERVGLDADDKRTVHKYSLGMKQRLAIAQAIMEKPDVLMLDEPTNGLDEEGICMIRNIIREEKNRGSIILLASHSKEDIELLADIVYKISDGRIQQVMPGNQPLEQ